MKNFKKFMKLVLFALVGGKVGFSAARYGGGFLPSPSELGISKFTAIALILVSIPFGLFCSIFIHELGHLLFGVFAGMKPIAMMVGPFCWNFEEKRHRPKFSFAAGIAGGFTVCVPPKKAPNSNRGLKWFLIGGPLASLLLGVFCLIALPYAPDILKLPIGITLGLTFFLGIYNMIPNTVFGLHTDGARLVALFKGGQFADEMTAQFLLTALMHSDGSPDDWPQDKIDILTNAEEFSPEWRAGQYYAYMKAKFIEDWPAAKIHLMQAGDNLGDMAQTLKNGYVNEMAAFGALCDQKFDEAAKVLKATGKGLLSQRHTEAIYQAIIHIADGETARADEQLRAASNAAENAMFKGSIPLVLQDIQTLRAYLETNQDA